MFIKRCGRLALTVCAIGLGSNAFAHYVFFASQPSDSIYRCTNTGANLVTQYDSPDVDAPFGVTLGSNDMVYWTEDGAIMGAPDNGSGPVEEIVASTLAGDPRHIAVHTEEIFGFEVDTLYWTDFSGNRILSFDGSSVEVVAHGGFGGQGVAHPNGIAVLVGNVFWSQGNTIRNASGDAVVTVGLGSTIKDIDVIEGTEAPIFYWAEDTGSGGRIARQITVFGIPSTETLYTISSTPIGVAVAENLNKVFWTTAGKVEYGAMNGSTAKTTIVTGLSALKGIDFKQTN
ncbi:MAG: hypothetical protein L0Y44_11195 [Phycisphaerales bacterium]|nr:hypothetical protein [Phycisphaerales bacterium]